MAEGKEKAGGVFAAPAGLIGGNFSMADGAIGEKGVMQNRNQEGFGFRRSRSQ